MCAQDVLETLIKDEIRATGGMRIARYMQLCLAHPLYGYYIKNDPLGRDFTTSPEISQIFGEMIGIWVYMRWQEMGSPDALNLIELGPGRGTLMRDMLRVLVKFKVNVNVHLVEINQTLRKKQAQHVKATWYERLEDTPRKNAILIANEFLDCLPIQQFINGVERTIILENDQLAFSAQGHVIEHCPAYKALLSHLPNHALLIDYGGFGGGDTLQAMLNGSYVPPLTHCGLADLTAHVDFQTFEKNAREQGFKTKLTTQRDFLLSHGFEARYNALKDLTAIRLIENASPRAMGVLFKVIELSR